MPSSADVVSAKLFAQVTEISRRIEGDPTWAQSETEHVRLAFGDWSCLSESVHQRFHSGLPPIR